MSECRRKRLSSLTLFTENGSQVRVLYRPPFFRVTPVADLGPPPSTGANMNKFTLTVAILIILTGIACSAQVEDSSFTEETSAPMISKEATNLPAQSEPEILDAPTTLRVQTEGPWLEIGQAETDAEYLALEIPTDELVREMTPENEELFLALLDIDAPPTSNIEGVRPVNSQGWAFYIREGDIVTLYGWSDLHWSREKPQGLTYFKRNVRIIEGGGS